jgi:hypothetical protein
VSVVFGFAGQRCGFSGGYMPFAKTTADRLNARDPRPSVEERYGTLRGYVCAVKRAAVHAVQDRFLLQEDADRLIAQAGASGVLLPTDAESPSQNRDIANALCGPGG